MAKKDNAIYAPGELSKVRGRLGDLDEKEAKRIAQLLGGNVGVERGETPPDPSPPKASRGHPETAGGRSGGASRAPARRRNDLDAGAGSSGARAARKKEGDAADNPQVPVKLSYRERVKMDKYAGQSEFEIKTAIQVLQSVFSFLIPTPDYINPAFITRRLNEYYKRIELLVTSTRTILPRNNLRRNERLKKADPFAYGILNTIRYWNIEKITGDLAKIQAHPRVVKTVDLADILRAVYKPLFVLEMLDLETHIKEAYKMVYKIIYLENAAEAKEKYQDLIRSALGSLSLIRKDIRFLLYPLLLKILSDRWLPYETFFMARKKRLMAFLNVTEADRLVPGSVVKPSVEESQEENPGEGPEEEGNEEEFEDPEAEAKRAKQAAAESERKAVDRGLATLEALFPGAGWDRLSTFPDLYPYFADVFKLKGDYALIAPTDPLQQVVILLRILEELFFSLRYVSFGTINGPEGSLDRADEVLSPIINDWHYFIDSSFDKEYLPRLSEYCRILENTAESRTSNYARRLLNELHWAKRLYFLPYYKFESTFPPPFQKKDVSTLYPEIRQLRKYLTAVAAGIEQGNKQGGAEKRAPCDGIDNPWEPYVFQVPNPLSRRLDTLLDDKKKHNASLVFFTLAVVVVLDYIVNNEDSWAYAERSSTLFRSMNGEGVVPLRGVDTEIDSDGIFKQAQKDRNEKNQDNPSP